MRGLEVPEVNRFGKLSTNVFAHPDIWVILEGLLYPVIV